MINILHVADKLSLEGSTIHGVTRLFSWWLPNFETDRYRVQLCSLKGREKGGIYLEEQGIRVYYLDRNKFDPRTLIDLVRLTRRVKADILHLHGYGASNFGRLAGLLTGVPTIVHEHMYDHTIPAYQVLADRLLKGQAERAIAVSESVRDFLIQKRSLPPDKVEVIYNGMLPGSSGAQTIDWKKELCIEPDSFVVTTVGRLHPIKGQKFFLEAAKRIREEVLNTTFVVAGDGELMADLEKLALELGISSQVRFTGHIQDISGLLKSSDLMVISSLSEGIPLTLFEAMAAGCPVVSTWVGGIPEIFKDGKIGYLVPPGDSGALAQKIVTLLKNPALRATFSQNIKLESDRYDIHQTIYRIQRIYDELAERHKNNYPFFFHWHSSRKGVPEEQSKSRT